VESVQLEEVKKERHFLYGETSPYGQEAQLSQRGRAVLRVIEHFAKSLKFTKGHSK